MTDAEYIKQIRKEATAYATDSSPVGRMAGSMLWLLEREARLRHVAEATRELYIALEIMDGDASVCAQSDVRLARQTLAKALSALQQEKVT